jgi:leader peptidase (prepilin peptidase)/N-methyltransferase
VSWFSGPPIVPAVVAFVVGACLGRFLNRCIEQFPRHELLGGQLRSLFESSPARRMLSQARTVAHRLPVVGWLVPGNPLARTRRGENLRFAAVELVNGLLFAALLWAEFPQGFSAHPPDPFAVEVAGVTLPTPAGESLALQLVRFVAHLVLIEALVVASAIDIDKMIIPDGSTVPATLFALVVAGAAGGIWLVPIWYEDTWLAAVIGLSDQFDGGHETPAFVATHPHLHGFAVALAGLVVGGGTVWAVRLIGQWALGREAMGFGDVIFMAMIGSFLGWQPVLVVFFLAPLCAIVVVAFAAITGTSREFPYGPWLSVAAVLLLLGWRVIWPEAGRFFLMGRLIPIFAGTILILLAVLLRGMRLIRGDERWYPAGGSEWTSGDQLVYQSQEKPEPAPNSWAARRDGEWAGVASGRGTLGERRWRGGRRAS